MSYILAADTGGTFTDLAAYDSSTRTVIYTKSLTNYADLVQGVMDCIAKAGVDVSRAEAIKFGTTLVINTYVQRNGARCALVCTDGFRDVLDLRRGNRTKPFDLRYERDPPLAPRELRFGISARADANGAVLREVNPEEIAHIAEGIREADVEAVAVSLLNAYADPAPEQQVAEQLRTLLPDVYVTAATDLSREWYEFERTSTAIANAYVGPKLKAYVKQLHERLANDGFQRSFFLMASNGGAFSLSRAERQPVMLVESGPVGGCVGAGIYAQELGIAKAIAFDMGGTTAKCAVVEDGHFEVRSPYYVGGVDHGFPIRGGVLDIVEVGTGGGSVAWLDIQGALCVGPRSAGSAPGPVCYGRGGVEPTMTDANLMLGRIGESSLLGGEMKVDRGAAIRAIEDLATRLGLTGAKSGEELARGIIELGTLAMASAIKQITVERGVDAADYTLFAFGGGGPLFASTLARELNIPRVIIPPEPGNFSALGMILAKARVDETQTFIADLNDDAVAMMLERFSQMEAKMALGVREDFGGVSVAFERQLELAFKGQRHSIRIAMPHSCETPSIREAFEQSYLRRYGHVEPGSPLQLMGLVLAGTAEIERPTPWDISAPAGEVEPSPIGPRPVYFERPRQWFSTPILRRSSLSAGFRGQGPMIIEEYGSTTVIGPDDYFEVGRFGEISITFDKFGSL